VSTADSATQQSATNTAVQQDKSAGENKSKTKTSEQSSGINYLDDYPKAIKKSIEPSLKEEMEILIDFGMPEDNEELLIDNKNTKLIDVLNDLGNEADVKAPRYWFNTLAGKYDYRGILLFILNLKATLLNGKNTNFLKEWQLSDKINPQDVQEVGSIANLYDEKIIDKNTKTIKDIFDDDKINENRKMIFQEIIFNIAMGNLGGLYKESVKRRKGE